MTTVTGVLLQRSGYEEKYIFRPLSIGYRSPQLPTTTKANSEQVQDRTYRGKSSVCKGGVARECLVEATKCDVTPVPFPARWTPAIEAARRRAHVHSLCWPHPPTALCRRFVKRRTKLRNPPLPSVTKTNMVRNTRSRPSMVGWLRRFVEPRRFRFIHATIVAAPHSGSVRLIDRAPCLPFVGGVVSRRPLSEHLKKKSLAVGAA